MVSPSPLAEKSCQSDRGAAASLWSVLFQSVLGFSFFSPWRNKRVVSRPPGTVAPRTLFARGICGGIPRRTERSEERKRVKVRYPAGTRRVSGSFGAQSAEIKPVRRFSECRNPTTAAKRVSVLPVSMSEWTCPKCGVVHGRDENVAKNILRKASEQAA